MIKFTDSQIRNINRSVIAGIWVIVASCVYSISKMNKDFDHGIMPQVWKSEEQTQLANKNAIADMRREVDEKLSQIKKSCFVKPIGRK